MSENNIIGKCPRCGSDVTEGGKNYYCDKRDCGFILWKDDWFFTKKGKTITPEIASALLKEGRVLVNGFISARTGQPYDAFAVMDDTGQYINFKLEFPERQEKSGHVYCSKTCLSKDVPPDPQPEKPSQPIDEPKSPANNIVPDQVKDIYKAAAALGETTAQADEFALRNYGVQIKQMNAGQFSRMMSAYKKRAEEMSVGA